MHVLCLQFLKVLWKKWKSVRLPVHMPAISGFMFMMVKCTRLTQTKYLSVLQEEMHSARHSKLPVRKSLNLFMMLKFLFLLTVWVM